MMKEIKGCKYDCFGWQQMLYFNDRPPAKDAIFWALYKQSKFEGIIFKKITRLTDNYLVKIYVCQHCGQIYIIWENLNDDSWKKKPPESLWLG